MLLDSRIVAGEGEGEEMEEEMLRLEMLRRAMVREGEAEGEDIATGGVRFHICCANDAFSFFLLHPLFFYAVQNLEFGGRALAQ